MDKHNTPSTVAGPLAGLAEPTRPSFRLTPLAVVARFHGQWIHSDLGKLSQAERIGRILLAAG